MGHPDEGRIRAFLDGEAGVESLEIQAHLQSCSLCADLARGQEETMTVLTEALSLMDVAPVTDQVRDRISGLAGGTPGLEDPSLVQRNNASIQGPRSRESRRGPTALRSLVRENLPKAASVAILLTAGAAAALPGSPLREWFSGTGRDSADMEGLEAPGIVSPTTQQPQGSPPVGTEEVGASLPVKAGGMTIRIEEMKEGAEIRVRLVDGDRAGIFAGQGTRFRTEEGLMEARGAPGSVTIEVPRQTGRLELLVDGILFLRQRYGELEIPGPMRERTQDEIRFAPEAREAGG